MPDAESLNFLPPLPLPPGVRSRFVSPSGSELNIHILEAGSRGQPLIVLLHGFPELAFSWRKVLPLLAAGGYYVVAPDARGCGRTIGWDAKDLSTFAMTNLVRDVMVMVHELGYTQVHCIVGHDFGARTAVLAGLARPDRFLRVVTLAYPYGGPPKIPGGNGEVLEEPTPKESKEAEEPVLASLAALHPPRKPYKWYYAGPEAAADLLEPLSGLKEFLRGYFYLKSASWPGNQIHPLKEWSAVELAKMPYYYTMPLDCGMREAVRRELERSGCSPASSNTWLSDADLDAYAAEFAHTGFQGALNWYRVATSAVRQRDMALFADKPLEPPFLQLLGTADWGAYQIPGALEKSPASCTRYRGEQWIEAAGHFPHQEQPRVVADAILGHCAAAAT